MKYTKLLRFDVREGIIKNKMLFIMPILLGLTLFLNFYCKVNRYESLEMIKEGSVSFSDFLMYTYGGMKEYLPQTGERFLYPMIWMIVFITIPFILVNYPFKDMHSIGQQMLVRSGGRSSWWFSKCCWNVISTLLYHGILIMTAIVLCKMKQIPISSQLNWELQMDLFQIGDDDSFLVNETMSLAMVLLPILLSTALNVLQMTISLVIKPVFSFLVTLLVLVSCAYYLASYMIGNYAMLMRYEGIYKNGVSIGVGYLSVVIVLFVSILIGKIRFCHYDILNRE